MVEIWARPAGQVSLFDITASLVSAEEEALIEALRPRWNKGQTEDELVTAGD